MKNRKNEIGYTFVELMFIPIIIFGAIGWAWNVVKIIDGLNAEITGLFVFRVVGVFFAPLGVVLGYI